MIFGTKRQRDVILNIIINLDHIEIQLVDEPQNLDAIMDSYLQFETHVDIMLRNGYSTLKIIHRNRFCRPLSTKITLYESLGLSALCRYTL